MKQKEQLWFTILIISLLFFIQFWPMCLSKVMSFNARWSPGTNHPTTRRCAVTRATNKQTRCCKSEWSERNPWWWCICLAAYHLVQANCSFQPFFSHWQPNRWKCVVIASRDKHPVKMSKHFGVFAAAVRYNQGHHLNKKAAVQHENMFCST